MRRRKARATWFPIAPSYWGDGQVGTTFYQSTLTLAGTSDNGDTVIAAIPLALDQTENIDSTSEGVSLRDLVEGQDYLLQRVVGNVWMAMEQIDPGDPTSPQVHTVLGCMCLAVLPVDDTSQDTPAIDPQDYNPLLGQNCQQPWLWRRTWMLSNQRDSGRAFQYPRSSAEYGGNGIGGFLDTKGTVRRITKEQRLFLVAAAGVLDVTGGGDQGFVQWGLDLRVLGGMRRGKNRSTFK